MPDTVTIGFLLGLLSAIIYSISNILNKKAKQRGEESSHIMMSTGLTGALWMVPIALYLGGYTPEVLFLGGFLFFLKGASNYLHVSLLSFTSPSVLQVPALLASTFGLYASSILFNVSVSISEFVFSILIAFLSIIFIGVELKRDAVTGIKNNHFLSLMGLSLLSMGITNTIFIYNGTTLVNIGEILALISLVYLGSATTGFMAGIKRKRNGLMAAYRPSWGIVIGILSPLATFNLLYSMNSYPVGSIMIGVSFIMVLTAVGASLYSGERLHKVQYALLPVFTMLMVAKNIGV